MLLSVNWQQQIWPFVREILPALWNFPGVGSKSHSTAAIWNYVFHQTGAIPTKIRLPDI